MSSMNIVVNEETDEDALDQGSPVLEREVGPPSHPRPNIQPCKLADAASYGDNLGNVKFDLMHPDDLLELKLAGITNPHKKLEIINLHNREMISYRIAEAQHIGYRFNTPNGALRSFVDETDARYLISNIIPKPTHGERPAEDTPNVGIPPIHREPPPQKPRVIPKTNQSPAKPMSMLSTPTISATSNRTKSRPVPQENPEVHANIQKLLMQAADEMKLEEEEKQQSNVPSGPQRRSRKHNHPQKIQNGVEEEEPAPRAPFRAPISESRLPPTPIRVPTQTSILAPLQTPVNDISPVSNYSHSSMSIDIGDDQGHGSGQESVLGDGVSPNSKGPESPADKDTGLGSEVAKRLISSPSADTTVVNKDTKQADKYIDALPTDKPKDSPSAWSNPIVPQRDSAPRPSGHVSVKGAESKNNHQNADTSIDMDTTEEVKTPGRKSMITTTNTSMVRPKKRLTEADRLRAMDFGPKEGGKLGDLEVVWSTDKRRRTSLPSPEPSAKKVLPRRGAEEEKAIDDADDVEMEEEEEEREKKDEDKNTPGTSNGPSTVKVTGKRERKSMADGNEKAAKSQKRSESKTEDHEGEKESPVEKESGSQRKKESVKDSVAEIAPVLTPVQRSAEPSSISSSKTPPTVQSTPRNNQAKTFKIAPSTPQAGSHSNPIFVPEDTPEAVETLEPVRSSPADSPSGPTTSSIQVVKVHHINQPKVVPNLLPVQTVHQEHHSQPTPVARKSNPQPAVMNIPPFQAAPPHNSLPHNSSSTSVQQAIRAQQGIQPQRPPQYRVAQNQAQRHPIAPQPQSRHQQQPYTAQQRQQVQQNVNAQQQQHQQQHQQQQLQQRLEHQRQRAPQQQQQRRPNPHRPTQNKIPPNLSRLPVIPIAEPARPVNLITEPARPVIPIAEPARPVIPIAKPVRPTEPVLLKEHLNKTGKSIPQNFDPNYYNWTSADLSTWVKYVLNLNDDADPLLRKIIDEEINGMLLEEFLADGSNVLRALDMNTGRSGRIKVAAIKVINNHLRIQYVIDMAEYKLQMRLFETQQREIMQN
ncbi:hypothetical protein CRE_23642 [Caenorhabditis remanei]|uniref:SAM domain-containing protein n=1 Tax=Caenorhabditis remanei TaxID=31234 RepID=E3N488_CAERE|nr:hypothetical protein CRE_23642 [Caenorhabditis remanei]